jgi:hypothetical protein
MRRFLGGLGKGLWRFMVIFSFIVNLVLVVVLLGLVLLIFDIKNNIATPLVNGLHSSFVGLRDATIDWTIPVDQQATLNGDIPVNLDILLRQDTLVRLTEDVPITVQADITGPIILNNATVSLSLPRDLVLPVALDLTVPVNQNLTLSNQPMGVALDVRAVIPLSQTQLADPVNNLELLFNPLTRILGNLPSNWDQVGGFAGNILSGNLPNLLADTPYSQNPWPGFSRTAGLNYPFSQIVFPQASVPAFTGIVPIGGIPGLDSQLRPELYADGLTPAQVNAQAYQALAGNPVLLPETYNGTYGQVMFTPVDQARGELPAGQVPPPAGGGAPVTDGQPPAPTPVPGQPVDMGIITPAP